MRWTPDVGDHPPPALPMMLTFCFCFFWGGGEVQVPGKLAKLSGQMVPENPPDARSKLSGNVAGGITLLQEAIQGELVLVLQICKDRALGAHL